MISKHGFKIFFYTYTLRPENDKTTASQATMELQLAKCFSSLC